jgi:multicomponent Na+:H+ antiporter subunit A
MQTVYDVLVRTTLAVAKWQTRVLQTGSLFWYLIIIIGTTLAMVGWALSVSDAFRLDFVKPTVPIWLALLLLSMLVSIVVVLAARSRLLAICGLGVVGAGIAVIFLAFGAPDVALTQVMIETLTLIIAAIVLLRLPRFEKRRATGHAHHALRLAMAIVCGAVVSGLLHAVGHLEMDRTITAFYEEASYLKAHGRNIVNVILVDFRSLDTMGEIIVVAASALAAAVLIRKRGTPL